MGTDRGLEGIAVQKDSKCSYIWFGKKRQGWTALEQFMKALNKGHIVRVTGKGTGLTFNRLCCSFKSVISQLEILNNVQTTWIKLQTWVIQIPPFFSLYTV